MMESLVCTVNAIEAAPTGSEISGLLEHCEAHGLPMDMTACLVNMPGPTTIGRLQQALNAIASGEKSRESFMDQHVLKEEEVKTDFAVRNDTIDPTEVEGKDGTPQPPQPPLDEDIGEDAER